ncbi:MAG: DNA repair protein RecO [Pyrinomonadaceae bacterium]
MSLVETEGLILKSYSLVEADKIILVLTKNHGLIRGVAKGAKRLKSRFGGGLEPFTIVNITYFQREERELVSIRQIDLIKSFFENASDPNFLQKFAYLVELLIEFAPPHDPNERLFRMAKVCLETAAQNSQTLESMVVYFELWLLRLGGYLPDWNRCDRCKKTLDQSQRSTLQINFHLYCSACQKGKNNWLINGEQRRIFTSAQQLPPFEFYLANKNSERNLREISQILRRIISQILGRETIGEKVLLANT